MDAICFQLCDGNVIGSFCNWKTFLSRPLLPSLPFSYSLVKLFLPSSPSTNSNEFYTPSWTSVFFSKSKYCNVPKDFLDAFGAFSKMSNQQRLVILTTFAIWAFWLLGFVCTQMDFKEEERFFFVPVWLTKCLRNQLIQMIHEGWTIIAFFESHSTRTSVLIDNETAYLGTLSRNFSQLSEWIWIITNLDSCLSCYYRVINLQSCRDTFFQLRESTDVRETQTFLIRTIVYSFFSVQFVYLLYY